MPWHAYRSEDNFGNWFSPSSVWVLGIEHRSFIMFDQANTFTLSSLAFCNTELNCVQFSTAP